VGDTASANPQRWNVNSVNFGMNVSAVPAGSYAAWVFGYGLENDAALADADDDDDGYNNLAEYALGMNPTNSNIESVPYAGTAIENGTNWFEVVHNRRSDYKEQGLKYLLIDSTNLMDSVSFTNTQDQILVGSSTHEYEPVTNRYEVRDPVKFIKLEIQQD
jgi:hypothetical protein